MTDHEKLVMRNIIYAVETGGQVYGQKNYADFTEAYTNSSSEHAITIGAGQWYGNEARTLLLNIKAADAATFKKHDTAGVAADLAKTDWSNYRLSKTSAKAKAIVNIINSTVGRRCQDQLMDTQMEAYVKEAAALGVSNMDAKMMCANFRHQGGASAVKRILAKTTKPYTLDHLYAACQTDTGNQVGAYKSRQKMVYNALQTYITNYKVTAAEAIQAAIKIAKAEIGYLEKKSNANLDSKTANAGTANYTKYWRDADPANQASPWCACFISWVFMKAFGKATATKLLKHWPYIYVPTLAGLFTNYASPKVGDIFMYHNGSEFSHTGLGIGFLVTESHVQKCITVNRCKFNVLGVVVDTCNNNCITVFSTKSSVLVTVVNTKQSVCGISGQCGGLRINGILYFLVYLNLAFVQYRLLDLVQFGIQLTVNIKSADKYQKYNDLNRKKYLFLF